MDKPPAPNDTPKTAVFLSYSRTDEAFRTRLAAALEARGYAPIFDQSDRPHDDPDLRLTAQDEWWTTLKAMIASSDVMVFVVSPDSAASHVCDDEIAHARALGKRVIAILRGTVDFNVVPERLRALNVRIDFRNDAEPAFAAALDALCIELDLDIDWHRIGARLMRQADLWDKAGRPEAQLLRSGAIADADSWAARRPGNAPEPGDLLLGFLDASRTYERAQRDRQRRIIGRAFVKPAEQALAEGRADAALRLAAAGAVLAEDPDFTLVPELARAAARAAFEGPVRAVLHHEGGVKTAAFSPDGTRVVTASNDSKTASVWDVVTGAEISRLQGHEGGVSSAVFSPDGTRVVTASSDKTARVWDATSGAEIARLQGHENRVVSAAFNPDGTRVATASKDKSARVWDAATGAPIARLHGHERDLLYASFSPDGSRVITNSFDSAAIIWDAATGIEVARLKGHEGPLATAVFSTDGTRVVTASWDKTAKVWNAATGAEIASLLGHKDHVLSAAFSADGTRVITASRDKAGALWDAATGDVIVGMMGHKGAVHYAAFSPDGTRVVTASWDKTARIWDSATGAEIACLQGHEGGLYLAAFGPDGTRVVTASGDKTARVWDATTSAKISHLQGHTLQVNSAAFSRDGSRVVTASEDKSGRVWNAATGAEIARLVGHEGSVETAVFSPDGIRVATASEDKTARVWDAATGAEIACLQGHDFGVCTVVFSSDGSRAATGSRDHTARIWDVAATGAIRFGIAAVMAAGTRAGIGRRTLVEAEDLLMQDAPDDLHAALLALRPASERAGRAADAEAAAGILHAPRHPNCYLSQTEFAKKFGLELPSVILFEPVAANDFPSINTVRLGFMPGAGSPRAETASVTEASRSPDSPLDLPREPQITEVPLQPRGADTISRQQLSPGLGAGAVLALSLIIFALCAAILFALAWFGFLPIQR